MSNRRSNVSRIRGPQSALTDFLAANNISAQHIRDTFQQRQRDNAATNAQNASPDQIEVDDMVIAQAIAEEESTPKKRKRGADDKAKEKDKKKQKKKRSGGDNDDEDSDFDSLGAEMYQKSRPKAGQLENCESCNKRFTVTNYSKSGPDGGLLCTLCGKKSAAEDKTSKSKASNKAGTGQRRRKVESNRLDGVVNAGPKSLQQLCIEKVAAHHNDIDEFGDLPDALLDRLSEIFSKRRVLDPRTLQLFLRPGLDRVAINDAANLEVGDYQQIFAVTPHVRQVILRNACQFKDAVVDYMIEKAHAIEYLQLYAANLVSNEKWKQLFTHYGQQLKVVKLEWLDACFTDEVVETMVTHCPNIERLKLKFCRQLTSNFLSHLSKLQHLEHLSLQVSCSVPPEDVVELLTSVAPRLKTISLEGFPDTDDTVLQQIGTASSLTKLRLTEVDRVSDAELCKLFSQDSNETAIPPLRFVDLSAARDVDPSNPAGSEEAPIGLCSASFNALMSHSGALLRHLDISSCRHISEAAFCEAFDPKSRQYPELEVLNVSFCNDVDTSVIRGIFACCPKLSKVIAFGCFKIDHVVVPSGVALIGVPKAQDAIEQYGSAGIDIGNALDMMDAMGSIAEPIAV